MNLLLINTILLFVTLLYLKKYHERDNIHLVIPLTLTGNTVIIPGLMYIDILAVAFFFANIKKIKKINLFSLSLLVYMIYQIIVNWYYYSIGEFEGRFFSTIQPVLHSYIPIFLLLLLMENKIINVRRFMSKYFNFLLMLTVLYIFGKILLLLTNEDNIKLLIFTNGLSITLAVLSSYWFIVVNNAKLNKMSFYVLLLTLTCLLIGDVRGALIVFLILLGVSIFKLMKRRYIYLLLPFILSSLIFLINQIKKSSEIMSIVKLQIGLLFNQTLDESLLSSSERVRYILWTNAKDIWHENFLLGIGTNQFKGLQILESDVQLSPHHAIYTVATNGGMIGLIFLLFPVLFILFKKPIKLSSEMYWIKVYALFYILLAFSFGYSFNMYIIVFLYLGYLRFEKENHTLFEKNVPNQ